MEILANAPEFGEPTCMICGKVCRTVEYINKPVEMWCYCPVCGVDTFHEPLNKSSEYDE